VKGNPKGLTIDQSLEGLYTPRYDAYHFKMMGLPFKTYKIFGDGKEVKQFSIDKNKNVEFTFSKNFKHIELKSY
jgi:alpha-glucosidase